MDQVTDHVARALSREAQQLKGLPLWEGLVSAFATEVQAVENALFGLVAGRARPTATGVQLDGLGAIVGEPRNGADDATYRQRLTARIALNTGSGEVERLITILSLVTGATVEVTEGGIADLLVRLHGAVADGTTPAQLLAAARAAAVDGHLVWSLVADAQTLLFDDAPGLGDINNPATGGELAGELVA